MQTNRKYFATFRCLVLLVFGGFSAHAQCTAEYVNSLAKSAFVVGIDDYDDQSETLHNAVTDAVAVASTLQSLGFKPILDTNVDKKKLTDDLIRWTENLQKNNVKVAIFYFAGHGAQIGADNFLYLKDAIFSSDHDIVIGHTYSVKGLISDMQTANDGINILVLDACRDNPTRSAKRSLTKSGLTTIKLTHPGILVGYPVPEGQTTLDGEGGRNSLYATAFINNITTPKVGVNKIFGKIADEVYRLSGTKHQVAFVNTSIGDENDVCISYSNDENSVDFFQSSSVKKDIGDFRRKMAVLTPAVSEDTLNTLIYKIQLLVEGVGKRLRDSLGKQFIFGESSQPDYANSRCTLIYDFGNPHYPKTVIQAKIDVKISPTSIFSLITLRDEANRGKKFEIAHKIPSQEPLELLRSNPDWTKISESTLEFFFNRKEILLGID